MAKRILDKLSNSKLLYGLLFSFFFILTFLIFREYIVNDIIPLSGDGCGYLNIEYYARECMKNGMLPLWNPYMNAGRSFSSDISFFVFYPIRIIFSWLPTKCFFYAFYSFHLAFGTVGFFMYLKEIRCRQIVSLLMSFTYYFSICLGGFRKSHLLIIVCSVYLPWILFLIERYYRTREANYLFVSSLFLACQFFAGFPQDALYTDIIAGIYLIVLGVHNKWPILKLVRDCIAWVAFYIGLSFVQLIPFGEMYYRFSRYGASEMSFDQFRTFSIHPIKLFMMLCPTIFSDYAGGALSELGSIECQSEIFIGTISFSLIVLAVIRYRKNFRAQLFLGFMVMIFIYAMNGESDFLARLVYHIPILGAFRCSSRVVFAYVFFGLAMTAYTLENLIKDNQYQSLLKVVGAEVAFLLVILLANLSELSTIENASVTARSVIDRFSKSIGVLFAIGIGIIIVKKLKIYKELFIVVLCVGLIIYDEYPYWRISNTFSMSEFGIDNDVEKFLVDHKDEGKVLLASPYIDGTYDSAIARSFALSLGIQGINSYTATNDPRLSLLFTNVKKLTPAFNYSGLYTGFPEISKNLYKDNDLISMLGVKYIIDQEGLLPTKDMYGEVKFVKGNCISEDSVLISSSKDISVVSYPFIVDKNQNYRVSFDCIDKVNDGAFIYLDFFHDGIYDNDDQQIEIHFEEGKTHYEYIINSGLVPDIENVYLRIICQDLDTDIHFTNFKMDKVECEIKENPYKLVYSADGINIYENQNYKEILYTPKRVESIKDKNNIYGHNEDYDFDDVAYVEEDENFNTSETEIADIIFKVNSITANVEAKGKSFVIFSQASDNGWKAFVDGRIVKNYDVNGYIQGIELDSGLHSIKFVYIPVPLIVGCVASLIIFVVWVYVIFFRREREDA